MMLFFFFFFFVNQKMSYDMRISDWSSDVCSSDLVFCGALLLEAPGSSRGAVLDLLGEASTIVIEQEIGRDPGDGECDDHRPDDLDRARSEERREGNVSVSPCRSRRTTKD